MSFKILLRGLIIYSLFIATSCTKEDDEPIVSPVVTASEGTFTVTIENVFEGKEYFNNGSTGLITPGMSESFSFNAGKGHYLSFATMLVQSNDLFYAPDGSGIALYDNHGNAVTGDVTSMVNLWDAGTEVNEEPGVGANQPPRQSGPNTGMTENGTVKLITNVSDGFSYPADEDIIKVTLVHDGGTMFTVTIENKSSSSSLPSPLAPGVWTVNSHMQTPIFKENMAATEGLEKIAEDGDNSMINTMLMMESGYVSPFAPGTYGINNPVFITGQAASADLQALAEDGNPSGFSMVFNTPTGASAPAPIFPSDAYTFTFDAKVGDKLSFATMLVQSNDWFVGADAIELFKNGSAISGDITSMVNLYDGGTEVDQYAGAGDNQPVRQSGPNTGDDENSTVEIETSPSSNMPTVTKMVKVTITMN